MNRIVFTVASVALLLAGVCHAQTSTARPPATQSATSRPAVSPQAEAILDRVEAAGAKALAIKAHMKYVRNQTLVKDVTTRDGSVAYLKQIDRNEGKPVEHVFFRIQFDNLQTEDFVSTKRETYSFDGRFLHELNEKTEQFIHHEVVRAGQVLDPTRLGQGPFPAPFGQRKEDVLANFSVSLVAPAAGDPKGTDHLDLTPLKGADLARKYRRVHLFVSRDLNIPIRMVTESTDDELVTVDFTDIELNPKLTPADFQLKNPKKFAESTVPLDGGKS